MIIRGNRLVTRVRSFLTLVILFGVSLLIKACTYLSNPQAATESTSAISSTHSKQPRYLAFYQLNTQQFTHLVPYQKLPKIYFPPLKVNLKPNENENYSLSQDVSGQVRFKSDFTRNYPFNGFLPKGERLKSEGQFIAQMPKDFRAGLFVKYYYTLPNDHKENVYPYNTYELRASIEFFDATNQAQPIQRLWEGSIFFRLSSEIEFEQALNLGFKKISEYYYQTKAEEGSFHVLDL